MKIRIYKKHILETADDLRTDGEEVVRLARRLGGSGRVSVNRSGDTATVEVTGVPASGSAALRRFVAGIDGEVVAGRNPKATKKKAKKKAARRSNAGGWAARRKWETDAIDRGVFGELDALAPKRKPKSALATEPPPGLTPNQKVKWRALRVAMLDLKALKRGNASLRMVTAAQKALARADEEYNMSLMKEAAFRGPRGSNPSRRRKTSKKKAKKTATKRKATTMASKSSITKGMTMSAAAKAAGVSLQALKKAIGSSAKGGTRPLTTGQAAKARALAKSGKKTAKKKAKKTTKRRTKKVAKRSTRKVAKKTTKRKATKKKAKKTARRRR